MPEGSKTPRSYVGVVTVDDQPSFRGVVRDVIEAPAGFALLGEAGSGEEGVEVAGQVDPDLVLVDVRMAGLDGFETTRRLHAAHPAATIVLISTDDVTGSSCDACGAATFLPKKAFGPAALRRLWAAHGRPAEPEPVARED
jgi:two-component system invasion response regulator UvrY